MIIRESTKMLTMANASAKVMMAMGAESFFTVNPLMLNSWCTPHDPTRRGQQKAQGDHHHHTHVSLLGHLPTTGALFDTMGA
ncbi:unannotated protein [freshwater metagenome]|uniref:Unannotated protein n=1 Tax=freshwater metagenome TaxID=449393 RepID=A0A6J7GYR3_9ZZZZ